MCYQILVLLSPKDEFVMNYSSCSEFYSNRSPKSRRYQIPAPLAPRKIICHELFFIYRIIFEQ
jgi:hypothetical protein